MNCRRSRDGSTSDQRYFRPSISSAFMVGDVKAMAVVTVSPWMLVFFGTGTRHVVLRRAGTTTLPSAGNVLKDVP